MRSIILQIVDYIFGYDFFISYSHKDGSTYSRALSEKLEEKGYRTFLDERDYKPGDELRRATKRRVTMSTYLVVVARPFALESTWVAREVRVALTKHRTPILIDIDDSFHAAENGGPVKSQLVDHLRIHEPASSPTKPSIEVLDKIIESFQATRQEAKRLRVATGLAIFFIILSILAYWQFRQADKARQDAEIQANNAKARLLVKHIQQPLFPKNSRDASYNIRVLLALQALEFAKKSQSRTTLLDNQKILLDLYGSNPSIIGYIWPENQDIHKMAFSPDGNLFVVGGEVWDIESLTRIHSFPATSELGPKGFWFGDDGVIRAVIADKDVLQFWKIGNESTTPVRIGQLSLGGDVSVIALSPDGKIVAAGMSNGKLVITKWNSTIPLYRSPQTHDGAIKSLAFSPDNLLFASGGRDGQVQIWDVGHHTHVATLPTKDTRSVTALAFTADSTQLAVGRSDDGSREGVIRQWSVKSYTALGESFFWDEPGSTAMGLAYTSSGELAVASRYGHRPNFYGNLMLLNAYDTSKERFLEGDQGPFLSVAVSSDRRLVAAGIPGGGVILWDVSKENRTGKILAWNYKSTMNSIVISPDRSILAIADDTGAIRLFDGKSLNQVSMRLTKSSSPISSMAFDGSGKLLFATNRLGELLAWNIENDKMIKKASTDSTEKTWCLAVNHDGNRLVLGNKEEETVTVWTFTSKRILQETEIPLPNSGGVWNIAYSPFRNQAIIGTKNSKLFVLETINQSHLTDTLELSQEYYPVTDIEFSPDGKLFAVARNKSWVLILDTETLERVSRLDDPRQFPIKELQRAGIDKITFSPSGRYLACSGVQNQLYPENGGMVVVWDLDLTSTLTSVNHNSAIDAITFGRGEESIIGWDRTGKSIEWNIFVHKQACRLVGRNFTLSEWERFVGDNDYTKTCPEFTSNH